MSMREVPDDARVLIVLMGAIGDVVRAMVVPTLLKQYLPKCHVTWLVEPKSRDILTLHPHVDEIIEFQRGTPLRGVIGLYHMLRARSFDVVLDLQRHLKSGVFGRFAHGTRRIGFHPRNSKEGNWLFQGEHIPFETEEFSKIDHYARFVEHLGFPRPSRLKSGLESLDPGDVLARYEVRSSGPFVGLVMGSSWDSKDWPLPGYFEVARSIATECNATVLLLGDARQMRGATELVAAVGSDRIVNLCGRTTLSDVARILKACSICAGPDSGPGHIAAAVGVPYVGVFGPTSPTRVAPYGSEDLAIASGIGCAPCVRRECPGLNKLCMRLIDPRAVFSHIRAALAPRAAN